jgi:hypothetical protein
MLFSRNKLTHLLKTKDLAFLEAKNKLVFERKKGQSNPKKWPKT